nr:hypothetical protein [Oscillospiraceae bacterium]
MKRSKFFIVLLIAVLSLFAFSSCGADGFSAGGGAADYSGADGGGYTEGMPELPEDSAPNGEGEVTDGSEGKGDYDSDRNTAGLITAAAWNDNDNYSYWLSLISQSADGTNRFEELIKDNSRYWSLSTFNRVKVTLTDGENPLAGAEILFADGEGNVTFGAVTDANGVAYGFPTDYAKITATVGTAALTVDAEEGKSEYGLTLDAESIKRDIIDLMLVVDVTGSMGDELSFLANELSDVVKSVAESNKNAVINLALLFYRDKGDSEVYSYHDFLDVTVEENLNEQIRNIKSKFATGGGDYPEAVDGALELALSKQWSSSASTKIIFQVLDAPPHSEADNQTRFATEAKRAAELGIRICPIICSGADLFTEYLMRTAAIVTGGTFVFVTDDSGIGNPHHDPDLPNVTVEALNALMIRLINGYHTGSFAPPVYYKEALRGTTAII